ncbi:hypothetical protein B0H19DRAFT_1336862 [Mycena capillaripes]|nr:hypothetical protein B0H19DRAFT_1336862 [Mycena capillaripes]
MHQIHAQILTYTCVDILFSSRSTHKGQQLEFYCAETSDRLFLDAANNSNRHAFCYAAGLMRVSDKGLILAASEGILVEHGQDDADMILTRGVAGKRRGTTVEKKEDHSIRAG